MAAITKGDILAGSVGAVIGEIVAAQYRESLGDDYDPSKEDFEKLKERGVQLARLSAAFAAFLTGRDPNDAAMTAGNAARENAMQVTVEQYLAEQQASAPATEEEEEGEEEEEPGVKAAILNSLKSYDREKEVQEQQEDEERRVGILEDIFTPQTEAEWVTFRQARAELEENDPATSKRDKGKERIYDRDEEEAEAAPSSSSSSASGSIADRVAEARHRQIDNLLGGSTEDGQFVFDNTTPNRSTGGSVETHSPFWQDVLEHTGFGRHGGRMLGIPCQELEGDRPTTYAQTKQKAWTAIKNKEALQAIKMAIEDGSNLYSSKIQTLRQTGEWEHLGAYQRGSLILDAIQLEMNRPLTGTGHLLLEAFKGTKWALQTAKAPLDPDYKTDIGRLIERAQAEGTWEQRYTPEAWASLLETNQQQLHRARVISGIAEGFTEGLLLPGKIIHTTLDAGQAGLQHLGCSWETARTIREIANDALLLWPAARLSVAGLGLATSQRSASAILAKNRLGVPPSRTVQALDLSAAAASGALPQEAMLLSERARNLLSKQTSAKNLAQPTTAADNLQSTTTKTKTRGQGEKQITDARPVNTLMSEKPGNSSTAVSTASKTGTNNELPLHQRQQPYNPHQMRSDLEAVYGSKNVSSTTLPNAGAPGTRYANTQHPRSGIVYDQRGFPIFDSALIYETMLPSKVVTKRSRKADMRMATRQLRQDITSNLVSKEQFTSTQLIDIMSGKAKIAGLTWHHHQGTGRMQLVPENLHNKTPHTGGIGLKK